MRLWPFGRKDEQGEDMPDGWQDDDQELYEGDEGDGAGGEGGDDEAPALDPETQALVERETQKRTAQNEAQRLAELEKVGLTLDAAGRPAVANFDRMAQWFGGAPQSQQPAATPAAAPAQEGDDLGEMPSPAYEPERFAEWLTRRDALVAKRATAEILPQVEEIRQQFARSQVSSATARAKQELEGIGLGHVAGHPEFEARFQEVLLGQPVSVWENPDMLTMMAAGVARHLPKQAAAPQQPRTPDGRYAEAEAMRRSLAQNSTGEGGRVPPAAQALDPAEKRMAAALGMSEAEYRHYLQFDDYESHRQFQSQRQRRQRA